MAEIRTLQDRAIKGMELLFPDCEDLDAQRTYSQGPTVGEAREYIFPELEWLWNEWIDQAHTAGHTV